MGNQLELLEAEALKLTAGERAAFAQLLLASLDEDTEMEDAWAAETERRIAEIESGAVQAIPIAEALAQVRAALKCSLSSLRPRSPNCRTRPRSMR